VGNESLDKALANGGTAIGGWVSGGGDFTLGIYRRAGYDYVGLDCQHSAINEAMAADILQRTPAGSPATIVRVSKNDSALIGRVADAGADGVIVPMVSTVAEAEAAVRAVHYPPRGVRSFGPIHSSMRGDDLDTLAARVRVFVMIETLDGLTNVEDICAVEGLAGVDVGPADLSIGLGLNPRTAFSTDQLVEPIEKIRKACEANNIFLAMHVIGVEVSRKWIDRGVRLASYSSDASMFLDAAVTGLAGIREGAAPSTAPGLATPYGA
jgi:4-hydroxy-2-oxoheptanedioate aldolase